MNGYWAAARIERARPRIVERRSARGSHYDPRSRHLASMNLAGPEDLDSVGAASADPPASELLLGERWASIRERWSQLTFYLFDAEGWR